MGSEFGFAYFYGLRMDDEIMTRDELPPECGNRKDAKYYFFKLETKFIVEDEQGTTIDVLGSERFQAGMEVGDDSILLLAMGSRLLEEYWMTPREVANLCDSAVDFARKIETDLDVIPVVVEIRVCTVQQAGEPIALTYERAIQPDRLRPLYMDIFSL